MNNPHQVTRDFEEALCSYTGAPYAVAVNSCTMALLLAVKWHIKNHRWTVCEHMMARRSGKPVSIPKYTYISVPMSIMHADGYPEFRDDDWHGSYQLKPYPIWDSARWFTTDLWNILTKKDGGGMVCVSFHASKTLGIEQGGAILHNYPEADKWFRKARFDGRTEGVAPKDDMFDMIGYHCYLNPSTAAQGLLKLASLPRHNAPLPNSDYPDLSTMEIFK